MIQGNPYTLWVVFNVAGRRIDSRVSKLKEYATYPLSVAQGNHMELPGDALLRPGGLGCRWEPRSPRSGD